MLSSSALLRAFRTSLSVLSVLALVAGCSSHDEHEEHAEHVNFVVTSPMVKDTTTTREYVCQIRALQHIELRALERGYLEHIYVDEGQLVRKGQVMFQIKPVIYEAEYDQTAAEAKVAEIEYLNTKQLAEKNVVSPNELAMSKARYDQARAHMALAKAHLSFTKVVAPFTGIMNRLQARVGSLLEEGDMLSALADNSSMWVYFNVPEAQYLNYQTAADAARHQQVQLKMANGQIFEQMGTVTTIEADFNSETGNIAFRATFPNPKGLLRHGETGNILMTDELKNAMLIPQMATFEVLDKKFVFVVGRDSVVRTRPIKIRAEMPYLFAVESGLQPGERILLEGIRKVKENQKISYTYKDPASVASKLKLYAE
jgi:membrane fusion protein (multidrug efflux system)